MSMFDENHLKFDNVILVWDGVTTPEQEQSGALKRNIKVVVTPNNPDLMLLDKLIQRKLQMSDFKGVWPQGARSPIAPVDASKYNGMFGGYYCFNCNTRTAIDFYDENGQQHNDTMWWGPRIYTGQRLNILIHCYDYNEFGNKGIAVGLDAIQIVESVQAPRLRLQFGTGGVDTRSAFGGQQQAQTAGAHLPGHTYQQPNSGQQLALEQQPMYGHQPLNSGPLPNYGQQPSYGQPNSGLQHLYEPQQLGNGYNPAPPAGQSPPSNNYQQPGNAYGATTSLSNPQQMRPEQYLPQR